MTKPVRAGPAKPAGGVLPGDRDVWLFIMAELLLFSAFFIAFAVYRRAEIEVFNAGQGTLNRSLGVLNTLLLITSSWAVVRAVEAGRAARSADVVRGLNRALLMAGGFVGVKYLEYSAKFADGIALSTNTFYGFYFALTLIHLAHVLAGSVILFVVRQNAKHGAYHPQAMRGLEAGASYWHMVDLLWVFLFALLYLLR